LATVGPAQVELDRDVAGRRAAEHRDREQRPHRVEPALAKHVVLLVGEREPAERRAEVHADVARRAVGVIARVVQREPRRRDRELREAIGPAQALVGEKVTRLEVVDLRRDARPVTIRVEARDRRDGDALRQNAVPERRHPDPERRDDADPGDDDAMRVARARAVHARASASAFTRASVFAATPCTK
jgi:hypothetical protein